jgi:hypothetical protein
MTEWMFCQIKIQGLKRLAINMLDESFAAGLSVNESDFATLLPCVLSPITS